MTDTPTVEKKKYKKPPLTSSQKRARTRRRNVVKAKAGIKGKAARSAIQDMTHISEVLHKFSDKELSYIKIVVDTQLQLRKTQQKIFKAIYART